MPSLRDFGMDLSRRFSGMSGMTVGSPDGKIVRKLAEGDLARLLIQSYDLQLMARKRNYLSPFKICPIISVTSSKDIFSFTMPLIDGPTAKDVENGEIVKEYWIKCFKQRIRKEESGFRNKAFASLARIKKQGDYTNQCKQLITRCPDNYPFGIFHGDMGLRNIIVKDNECHLIDFAPSKIKTPLVDLATYEFSALGYKYEWQVELFDEAFNLIKEKYAHQYTVIKYLKILSYNMKDSEIERHLNGINRKRNI